MLTRALTCYVILIVLCWGCDESLAKDNLWNVLERDGKNLDIMALESVNNHAILVGAHYTEQNWQTNEGEEAKLLSSPVLRKQLHIISVNEDESIDWQHNYPALSDVQEIFAISHTEDNGLCIAYGRSYDEGELISPIVLQVNTNGKIIWANTHVISTSTLKLFKEQETIQIANIDSISMVGTPESGCLLGFVTRHLTSQSESYQLNLILLNAKGSEKWRYQQETNLYGKSFLARNKDVNQYTIVQTNQSRDAAILAMMAAEPFSPITDVIGVSKEGKLAYQEKNIKALSKVWVKAVLDAPGSSILLAGSSKTAWAGYFNITFDRTFGRKNQIKATFDTLGGEFSFVASSHPSIQNSSYIFVLGSSLVVTDKTLSQKNNQHIDALIIKSYENRYMSERLPQDISVQNIVPLGKNAYLVLYELGGKLLKIRAFK